MFETPHDPCSLLEGEATLPSPEKKPKQFHVGLNQDHNNGSPSRAEQLVCWIFPLRINRLNLLYTNVNRMVVFELNTSWKNTDLNMLNDCRSADSPDIS